MIHEWKRNEYLISTDRSKLNLEIIHDFLSRAYWSEGIPKELVKNLSGTLIALVCMSVSNRLASPASSQTSQHLATLAMSLFLKHIVVVGLVNGLWNQLYLAKSYRDFAAGCSPHATLTDCIARSVSLNSRRPNAGCKNTYRAST